MNNYELITDLIIKKLEEGIIPWRSPFRGHRMANANWLTKKPYHGINALMTSMMGKRSPYWLTFNQIKQTKDAKLPKGSRGVPILFAKYVEYVDDDNNTKTKSIYKRSYVFNLQDVQGIDCPVMEKNENMEMLDFNPIEECELLLEKIKPNLCPIRHIDDFRAFYSPLEDSISIANVDMFQENEDYYSTLFHEIIHSTGHESRMKRDLSGGKKSQKYAKEELIAEIGASFLCAEAGIIQSTLVDSASYIQSWLKQLRNDNHIVIQASSQAQKAVTFLNDVSKSEAA